MGMNFAVQITPIIVNAIIIIGIIVLILGVFRKRSNKQDFIMQENKKLNEENQQLKEKNIVLEKEISQLKNK